MGLSTEEVTELKDAYSLMSGDELRAQLGESAEMDALINAQLETGKAVEMKVKAPGSDDNDDADPPKAKTTTNSDDDDDDDDGETGFVDAHGNKLAVDANGKPIIPDDADQAAADAKAATTAEAAAAAATDVVDVSAEIAPIDLSMANDQFKDAVAKLDAQKAQALADMMDGTISSKEYAEIDAKYMSERDELRENRSLAIEWLREVHTFKLDVARTTGINYDTDTEKSEALDGWVKRLADKDPSKDGNWYLAEAHKKVMIEFDIKPAAAKAAPAPAAAAATATPAAAAKPAKVARAPDLSTIPPTLGGLPAAAEQDGGDGGEFAHLDKLSGMQYERALASLTPDQKARYEAM